MDPTLTLSPYSPVRWVRTDGLERPEGILQRCNVATMQKGLTHREGAQVVSLTVNISGAHRGSFNGAPPENIDVIMSNRAADAAFERDLPDFCDVRVERLVGGHVVHMTIWVPLAWNGRFFGLGRARQPIVSPLDLSRCGADHIPAPCSP